MEKSSFIYGKDELRGMIQEYSYKINVFNLNL